MSRLLLWGFNPEHKLRIEVVHHFREADGYRRRKSQREHLGRFCFLEDVIQVIQNNMLVLLKICLVDLEYKFSKVVAHFNIAACHEEGLVYYFIYSQYFVAWL